MDETVKQNIQSMIDSAIQNGITAGMSILVRKDNKYVCFIMHKPNDITRKTRYYGNACAA